MAADGGCIVFFAGGKRLPILGPAFWRSASAREIGLFIDSQLDERAIGPDSKDKLRCGRAIDARERN